MSRKSLTIAALAALVAAAPAVAAPGKPAKGDRDRDGLLDRHELLAGTDPAKADTDGDGVKDGREGAGRVVSHRGGKLVIRLFATGTAVRAKVTDDTEVLCPEPEEAEDEGVEDVPVEAEDAPAEDPGTDVPIDLPAELQSVEEEPVDDGVAEDEEADEEDEPACDEEDLVKGAVVAESETAGKARRKRWTSVTLAD